MEQSKFYQVSQLVKQLDDLLTGTCGDLELETVSPGTLTVFTRHSISVIADLGTVLGNGLEGAEIARRARP